MKNKNLVFAGLFKKYRLRSEIETLSEFANLMAEEGMVYVLSLFTRWQNGERIPTDRRAGISMVKIFVRRGGMNSVDEANELLESVGMRDLATQEIEEIQGVFILSIDKKQVKDNIKYFCKNKYLNTWNIIYKFFRYKNNLILTLLFISFSLIWLIISKDYPYYIGNIYAFMALIGIAFSMDLAFFSSYKNKFIGKSLLFFGLGLLGQLFGQIFYAYYILVKNIQIPYPSFGDIGYVSTIPLYIAGLFFLSRSLGINISKHPYYKVISAIILPMIMLSVTYIHLLSDYNFHWGNLGRILLDLFYPLGQAFYIFISMTILSFSRGVFGDMKNKIRFIIIALFTQYMADYIFIYQAYKGSWVNGGFNDYIYYLSYFFMTLAIMQFYRPIQNRNLQ